MDIEKEIDTRKGRMLTLMREIHRTEGELRLLESMKKDGAIIEDKKEDDNGTKTS